MSYAVGDIVIPRRRYAARTTPYTTSAAGVRTYQEDRLIDWNGTRSGVARVTEVIPSGTLTRTFFDRSGSTTPRAIVVNPAAWVTLTVYAPGAYVTRSGLLWKCTGGGTSGATGPTGTSPATDGSVTWVQVLAPDSCDGTLDPVRAETLYEVTVWDIDAQTFATAYYPASELATPITYAEWLELPGGSAAESNPINVLPYVSAGHIDLGSPPPAVAELARAYELSGIDPRP